MFLGQGSLKKFNRRKMAEAYGQWGRVQVKTYYVVGETMGEYLSKETLEQ